MLTPVFSARSRLSYALHAAASLGLALCLVLPASAAGPKAYVGNFKDNTVSVIDTQGLTVLATIPVAAGPDGIAITPDNATVFVSGASASSVSVIDAVANRVMRAIEVGKGPQGLALTPWLSRPMASACWWR